MVAETAMLTPCLERKVADNAAFNLPTSWRVQRMECDAMDMERLLSILDSGPVVLVGRTFYGTMSGSPRQGWNHFNRRRGSKTGQTVHTVRSGGVVTGKWPAVNRFEIFHASVDWFPSHWTLYNPLTSTLIRP
jgi:hypothetical protein